jgi:Gpi18-like mannosyltransferase
MYGSVRILTKIEKKAIDFIKNNIMFFAMFALVLISLIIRWSGIHYRSGDYNIFLQPWFNQIKSEGGFASLKHRIGNYNVPYMFILTLLTYLPIRPIMSIKIVSIIFDYVCAITATSIVFNVLGRTKDAIFPSLITFSVMQFLPTVLLNSAFWGQCDSIYSAFIMLCVLYLIKENYILAFVFFSIALSFKLQAIFVFPLLIILYFVKNKFSILHFFIIPIIFLISITPALIAGRPFQEVVKIYLNQTKENRAMFVNYSGLYTLFKGKFFDFKIFGILLTIAILGIMIFIIIYKKYDISKSNIISLSVWIVYICIYFLPGMHERYGFTLDILSVVYFIVKRKRIYIPIVINFVSLIDYCGHLFPGNVFNDSYLALANLIIIVILTFDILTDLKNDNAVNIIKEDERIIFDSKNHEITETEATLI